MFSEIEHTLRRELDHVASSLDVPHRPILTEATSRSRWPAAAPALVAAAVVAAVLITGVALLPMAGTDRGNPAPAQAPTTVIDDESDSRAAPAAPVAVAEVLYVGGERVPGRWLSAYGKGTHWMGERADLSWWWGYDASPAQLDGTMYQPPVISPSAGYVARVVSENGGAMLIGSDTEFGGEGFGFDLPGAGLDPALRAVAVTDAGLVVVAGTDFQRMWRPLLDEKSIDLSQTAPGQVVIGNTAAGLLVNDGDDYATDGTQGEPYLARLSEDGVLDRLGRVPTHDVLEASEQWLAYVPPGTVSGRASGSTTLRIQQVDGSAPGVLTPPSGWLFVAPGFRWESSDRLLALVVTQDGGDEALMRCRPEPASCVFVDLP